MGSRTPRLVELRTHRPELELYRWYFEKIEVHASQVRLHPGCIFAAPEDASRRGKRSFDPARGGHYGNRAVFPISNSLWFETRLIHRTRTRRVAH